MKLLLLLGLFLASCADMARAYTTCKDDPNFYYYGNSNYGCGWVKHYDKCNEPHDNGNVIGETYCPVSCEECSNNVDTDSVTVETCYEYGQDVVAHFTNKSPHPEDWLGIYSANANPDNLGSSHIDWSWLCGANFCKVLYGHILFSNTLPPGTYSAHLVRRNSGGIYKSYAESVNFAVKSSSQSCSGPAPTAPPHPSPTAPPHPAPTMAPYSYPTPTHPPQVAPTPTTTPEVAPTHPPGCTSEAIYNDKNCYVKGESINIGFNQCTPEPDDWVAIYYKDENDDNLGDGYRLWVWACGNQDCAGNVYDGSITFDSGYPLESGLDSWPLDVGEYQTHLIRRNSGGPYSSYLTTTSFAVVGPYDTCPNPPPHPGPTPTVAPVPPPTSAPVHPPTHPPVPAPTNPPHPGPSHPPVMPPSSGKGKGKGNSKSSRSGKRNLNARRRRDVRGAAI